MYFFQECKSNQLLLLSNGDCEVDKNNVLEDVISWFTLKFRDLFDKLHGKTACVLFGKEDILNFL